MVTPKQKQKRGRLTDSRVRTVKKPGRYGDGRGSYGLSLLVKPTKAGWWSKTWSQRLKIKGTFCTRGLGSYPLVSLAMARERAFDNATRVASGEDIRKPLREVPTVAEAFGKYIAAASPAWRGEYTEAKWWASLKACRSMEAMLVSEVTSSDVLKVIEPIWKKHPVKAELIRMHISCVMKHAMTEGYRVTDPAASSVTRHLPKHKRGDVKHHPSIPYKKVGAAMAMVRDDPGTSWVVKVVTIFVMLTTARKSNVLEATWDQFDLDAEEPVWHIPMTKNDDALDIPLPTQVVELLLFVEERTGRSAGVVFPGKAKGGILSACTVNKFMERLALDASPHGSRSSFRNWAGDMRQDPYASEKALGHRVSNAVVESYLTTDFLELRGPLMQEWADFIEETMGPVIGESW